MKTRQSEICFCIIITVLFAVMLFMGRNIDRLIADNKKLQMEVSHSEIIIDSLETMCNLQIEQIELYDGFVLADSKVIIELNEKIKAYQAYNDALEGRTRKLADAYQFRERDLLEGMEMLRQELHQLNEEYEDLEARAAKFGEVAREQVMDLMNETKRLKEQLRLCGPQGPILHSPPIPDCR